jgi:hypothetical protein
MGTRRIDSVNSARTSNISLLRKGKRITFRGERKRLESESDEGQK